MSARGQEPSYRPQVEAAGMWWPIVILVSAVAVTAVITLQAGVPIRPIAAFWFFLVCPGMAFVPLLPIRDRLIQLGLAVALSIGLDGMVSEAMLYARAWSYQGELALLIGICLIGATLQVGQVLRRAGRSSAGQTPLG